MVKQKEEIEQVYNNFKLLSEIGQQITSCLSVEKIIETAYENINQLMDASSFWIGIYNESNNRLEYPIGKEKGKTIPFAYYDLSDDKWLPVQSFKMKKEIVVNDYRKEYKNYVTDFPPPIPAAGAMPESSIWFPLLSKEKKVIGILTIQSFHKHAYSEYHLNIVRNLAVFTSIALENALLFGQVEQKVSERTSEVLRRQEEVESAYQNVKLLSEIGKAMTSNLSIEKIIESTYQNINMLMDASVFAIGLYNEAEKRIEIPYAIEDSTRLPAADYYLSDDKRLAVWCFKNQKEIFINDLHKEYNTYIPNNILPPPLAGKNVESVLYLPLISKDNKPVGVISVQSFKKNAYTENHLNIIRNIAVFSTIALENAILYEQVEQKVKERTREVVKQKEEIEQSYENVKLLSEIGQMIISSLSVEKIIETTYENVNKLMDASGFGIGLADKEGNSILFPVYMEEGEKLKMIKYSLSDKNRLPVWCFENNKKIFINDLQHEITNFVKVHEKPLAGKEVNSLIYLPLEVKGKVIGVITVQSFRINAYSENHLNILKNFFENNKKIFINDLQHEITNFVKVHEKPLAGKEVNSLIYLPLEVKGKVIGVITVQSFRINAYSENHLNILKNLAVFAEIALENAFFYENLEDKVKARTEEVLMQKREAEKQRALVEEKNKNIIASINYAKRIQNALLKEEEHVSKHLPAHFILFKPKDIISGDFYWSLEKQGHLYLVAADCTGHGVPGAMMSMLGIAFLNEINSTPELLAPSVVLDKLREKVVKELSQTGKEGKNNDGMDISIIRLNLSNNELQWAGANNSLYLIKDKELQEIKPNKQPIGYHAGMKAFSNTTIQLTKGTSFFLFTDGYADQFGGLNGKKFKHSQLKSLLLSIRQQPMKKQKEVLNNTFEKWKGDLEQVDDVCIVGMKV